MVRELSSVSSAHVDTFCRDHLPAPETQPRFESLPGGGERLNVAEELVDAGMRRFGRDHVCFRSPDGQVLTFGDLHDRSNRLANVLTDLLRLRPGNRVLLQGGNRFDLVVAWFAVLKAGGVVVTVLPTLRAGELTVIAERVAPSLMIRVSGELDELDAALGGEIPIHTLGGAGPRDLAAEMDAASAEFAPVSTSAEDIAILAPTSGTTGQPKITMHAHRDLIAIADSFARHVLEPRTGDLFVGSPPVAFTFGLGGLVVFPLRFGATSLLVERPTPAELARLCHDERATILLTAPTAYRDIVARGLAPLLSGVRRAVSSGEALDEETRQAVRREAGVHLINALGATEMLHAYVASRGRDDDRPGAIGRAVPGYRVAVLDDQGAPVPVGEIGRLGVVGPTGCRYLFGEGQAQHVVAGWNVIGDLVRQDADGWIWHEGRADSMIVSSGFNVSPRDVESALLGHPDVAECAVVGRADPLRGQTVYAFVVLRDGAVVDEDTERMLSSHVRSVIAPYKCPRTIEVIDALPRNAHGKVHYALLAQLAASR